MGVVLLDWRFSEFKLVTSCCCSQCCCVWFCMRTAVIFQLRILKCVGHGPLLWLRFCTTCQAWPWLKCTTTSSTRNIPNRPCSCIICLVCIPSQIPPRQRIGEQNFLRCRCWYNNEFRLKTSLASPTSQSWQACVQVRFDVR